MNTPDKNAHPLCQITDFYDGVILIEGMKTGIKLILDVMG